jgi:hypothetical protein
MIGGMGTKKTRRRSGLKATASRANDPLPGLKARGFAEGAVGVVERRAPDLKARGFTEAFRLVLEAVA